MGGRTVLWSTASRTWKDWLIANVGKSDHLMLDPASSHFGPPGRLILVRNGKTVAQEFLGWLNPMRVPEMWMSAAAKLLSKVEEGVVVELFPYRPNPLLLALAQDFVDLVQPDRIVLDSKLNLDYDSWPIGPEVVELPAAHQRNLQNALRKAQWLKLLSGCDEHRVPLSKIQFRGARIGSGTAMDANQRREVGLGSSLLAEVCGQTLFVVSEVPVDELHLARALDLTHTHQAQIAHPSAYEHLLCEFADAAGNGLGMGMIQDIDFEGLELIAKVQCIAPAPVRIVKLGGLRVNPDGIELGEAKRWEV